MEVDDNLVFYTVGLLKTIEKKGISLGGLVQDWEELIASKTNNKNNSQQNNSEEESEMSDTIIPPSSADTPRGSKKDTIANGGSENAS